MRHAVLLLLAFASVARADGKPKGHLVDPWARMPHPRDGEKLPDPRKAAEKATSDGVVAPVTPEPAPDVAPAPPPPPEPADADADVAPPIIATPAAATPPLPPAPTPFVTTKYAYVEPEVAPHAGLTLEAAIGFGAIYLRDRSHIFSSPGGVGGLDLGIGGWISETTAVTLRLAGSSTSTRDGIVFASWIGPSVQLWATDKTWFGVGVGLAGFGLDADDDRSDITLRGIGADLRVGHTIYAKGSHTLYGSFELTPSQVHYVFDDGYKVSAGLASMGLLIGWQYL